MKTTKAMTSGLLVVFSVVLGCGRGDAHADAGASVAEVGQRGSSHSYAFGAAGVRADSRVQRAIAADGAEVLRGTTEVTLAGSIPAVVSEKAELDATGRLVRVTSELSTGGRAAVRTVVLDAVKGSVTVRDAQGERSWLVPVDHPWLFTGLFGDVAPQVAGVTAVQVWVARRAAQADDHLRMVEVLPRRSSVTVPDQVVFADGERDLVVIGDEVAETDRDFVRALPWKALEMVSDELRAADLGCAPGPV